MCDDPNQVAWAILSRSVVHALDYDFPLCPSVALLVVIELLAAGMRRVARTLIGDLGNCAFECARALMNCIDEAS